MTDLRTNPGSDPLRDVRALVSGPSNPHVAAWKSAGKPVVGYACRYVPEEIIWAAGALPLRLRATGSDDSSLGDAYMSARVCTYVRHVVSLAMDGAFGFLDGQVSTNSCDHLRRAADLWKARTKVGFHGFVSVPRATRDDLYPYYRRELSRLYEQLASHFGTAPDPERLREAIRTWNEVRARLRRLEALRRLHAPKVTGADALAVHVGARSLPPDVFVDFVDPLFDVLEMGPALPEPRARLVLVGPELDEPTFVDAVEGQGALVVADQLCFGARGSLAPIDDEAADPLDALARARFFGPSCPRMIGAFPERWDALGKLVAEVHADGVVLARLLFCDPWGGELHNLSHRLETRGGFPLLTLTREYGVVPTGQVRTRVQAFVERLEIARAQRRAAGGES